MTGSTVSEKKKGFDYVKESADAGDPRGMLMMSIIYAKDEEGVVQASEELSKKFLIKACDLGYTPAEKLAQEIIKQSSDNGNN